MSIGARGQSDQTSEPASGHQTDVSETGRGGGGNSLIEPPHPHPTQFTFRYFPFLAAELSE